MRLPGMARRAAVETLGGRTTHGEEQDGASRTRAQRGRLSAITQPSCSPQTARCLRSPPTTRRSGEKSSDTSSEVDEKGAPAIGEPHRDAEKRGGASRTRTQRGRISACDRGTSTPHQLRSAPCPVLPSNRAALTLPSGSVADPIAPNPT
ncbi:hypothetical protein C2845_PM09G10910 [Panicum miliaceum]|uniref:Uncharacterized protein n=1 Tax=Panicum miliaceum TaxID=4540 RepID=A0A3L6S182_PANMI|nr:hypothetical protein C2845_PM09G10910 [Panicum miliaceum]